MYRNTKWSHYDHRQGGVRLLNKRGRHLPWIQSLDERPNDLFLARGRVLFLRSMLLPNMCLSVLRAQRIIFSKYGMSGTCFVSFFFQLSSTLEELFFSVGWKSPSYLSFSLCLSHFSFITKAHALKLCGYKGFWLLGSPILSDIFVLSNLVRHHRFLQSCPTSSFSPILSDIMVSWCGHKHRKNKKT